MYDSIWSWKQTDTLSFVPVIDQTRFPYANSLLQRASSAEKPGFSASQNSLWNGHQCYTLKMWVQLPTLLVPE